ncbi:MAG: DMT family transporter [Chloroflexota bacterium]
MNTYYALEQTTHSRISELQQHRTQINLAALAMEQDETGVQTASHALPFAHFRTATTAKFRLAIGTMLVVTLWFGLQTWMNQTAIHASSALAFNSERYAIAAVIMGFLCWRVRARFTKRAVLGGCAVGFAFALMITCESQALLLGSAERTSFLGSLFVILMPFLGLLFRGQKLYPVAVIGSVIVIIGTWCLFGAPNGSRGGDLFGLLRAGACAGMLLAIQHFADEDWRVSCFINLSVVAAFSIAVAGLTGQLQVSLQPTVLFPAAISAVLGSVAGASALIWSGRHLPSSLAGVLMFLEAPFTLLWGVLLMGAVLTPMSLLAYILIGTGAVCVLSAGSTALPQLNFRFVSQTKRSTPESALIVHTITEP